MKVEDETMNINRKFIFYLAVAGLVVMNFLPINGSKDDPPLFIFGLRHDLWLHIIAFVVLTFLAAWAFRLSFRKQGLMCLFVPLSFIALAAGLEYAQMLVPNRNVAWDDFYFSSIGAGLGSVTMWTNRRG
ncbi:MAG TPA: VanZ family protein [Bacteroidales bacterium]|nr:VanZ family protein [Bacteroidales bacterium]